MSKLLIENPQSVQELIEVGAGGGYFDPARVTWDERVNGTFPPALLPEVGGLVRSGATLVIDGPKKAAHLAAKAAKEAAEQNKILAKEAKKAAIKGMKSANSVAALRLIVAALAEELGYEVDP